MESVSRIFKEPIVNNWTKLALRFWETGLDVNLLEKKIWLGGMKSEQIQVSVVFEESFFTVDAKVLKSSLVGIWSP